VVHLSPSFVQWLKLLTHPNRKQRFSSAIVALQALEQPFVESQPIESSTTSTPVILQKPHDSQISLHKDAETLEIYLHREKSTVSIGVLGCLFPVGCFSTFISLSWLLAVVPIGNWVLILISLMLLYIGICCLYQSFSAANKRTRIHIHIHIDQKSMTVAETAFGRQQLVFQASRDSLYKLTYVKRFYRRDYIEAGIIEVQPELKIWARQGTATSYPIGQLLRANSFPQLYGYLTTQELDWLAQELSDWLGLPITRE
jgi:hypothetical protein